MLILAHRGASGYEKENTIPAFERALSLKADFIELDVQQTLDDIFIVRHDTRFADGTAPSDLTYDDICMRGGEQVLLFDDALRAFGDRIRINVEIKAVRNMDSLLQRLRPYQKNILLSSFNHEYIMYAHTHAPDILRGTLTVSRVCDPMALLNSLDSDILIQHFEHVDRAYVERLHSMDKKIFVWNVNNEKDMRYFYEIGVDGLFTDFPDKVIDLC